MESATTHYSLIKGCARQQVHRGKWMIWTVSYQYCFQSVLPKEWLGGGIRTLATYHEAWYSRGGLCQSTSCVTGFAKVLLTIPSIRPPSFPADQGFKITDVNHRSVLWMRFLCFRIRYPVYNPFHSSLNTNPPLWPSPIHKTRLILQ